jgi:uncharacterized membrane protein
VDEREGEVRASAGRSRTERGTASISVVLGTAVMAATTTWLMDAGVEVADRARAQAVADVVALAAASGGTEAGREVAEANGASVVRLEVAGGATAVTVALGDVAASAHATSEPG